MLFLRNIESCSLYQMRRNASRHLIWQAQISMSESCREIRNKSITDTIQTYRLDIERIGGNKKKEEAWLLCTGGHNVIKKDFFKELKELKEFSEDKRLKV